MRSKGALQNPVAYLMNFDQSWVEKPIQRPQNMTLIHNTSDTMAAALAATGAA